MTKNAWKLFLISLVGLYLEMCVIRWISAEVRVFAYAKNLVLLACYLGFGLGNFLAHKKANLVFSLAITAGLVVLVGLPASASGIDMITYGFNLFAGLQMMGTFDLALSPTQSVLLGIFGITAVIGFFLALMIMFIPYGQILGQYLKAHGDNIRAYSINILGSIVGIWLFTTLSFLYFPPMIWLVLGMLLSLIFLSEWRQRAIALVAVVVGVVFLWPSWGSEFWSSYQKLFITEGASFKAIAVNNSGYMSLEHMIPASPDDPASVNRWNLPYYFYPHPQDVMIVGAGAGNDAATAIAEGAEHIVAVEIDPLVYRLGQRFHPDSPYQDPRVEIVLDDARHYLSTTNRKFDLIIFSHLDSHTLLSSFTNVRLDNYIYTVESLQSARALLKKDGVIYLSFWANRPWIRDRLYNNLEVAMGHPPFLVSNYEALGGPKVEKIHLLSAVPERQAQIEQTYPGNWPGFTAYVPPANNVPTLTDDWPFLYIENHSIPLGILILMGSVAACSVALVALIFRRIGKGRSLRLNWHFFFLGAAFLLVETHNVSKLALVFGTTWIVNAWVVSAILVLILLANLCVDKFKLPSIYFVYGGLFLTLLLGYFIPVEVFIGLPGLVKALAAVSFYTVPVFFAGIIFSSSFARSAEPEHDLGSNMLGAILGGLLENVSFISGIRSLFLIAIGLYALSLVFLWVYSRVAKGAPAGPQAAPVGGGAK